MWNKKHWTDFCIFCYRDASVKRRDTELQQVGWWSHPRNGNEPALLTADLNLGKEIRAKNSASFAHLPIYILYSFQQLLFFGLFFYFCFSIFVLKKLFLELLLSISYRSLEIKVLQVPNPFVIVRLKWLLNRRIQHKTWWQGWSVILILKNDTFKGEKKSQLQLSGHDNTWLCVVATSTKKV